MASRLPLDRKVPRNKRYENVCATIDSGRTVDKVRLISSREFLKRREEPFCRVSVHQMEELLSEYEADQYEGVQDFEQNMSDGPRVVTHEEEAVAAYDRPYLILDVRGPSEFASCHLLQARNFPAVLLNQDKMTSEVFRYKNLEHSLIILYCEDERISTQTASRLVQRGFDNVYILSGGLTGFAKVYPAYVEGRLPLREASASLKKSPRGASRMTRRASFGSGSSRGFGSSRAGSATGTHRSDAMSVAESVISRSLSRRGR